MEIIIIVITVVFIMVLVWLVVIFNSLVRLRNAVKTAWSGIDVQLKRRADLIPNLINIVKGYAKHEKDLLENVTKARTAVLQSSAIGDVRGSANAENMLSGALKSLFAVAENYPDLKANQNFLKMQTDLTETEDQIAASRRIYNENVNYLNTNIESFPSNIIAMLFSFEKRDFFEANGKDRELPNVSF